MFMLQQCCCLFYYWGYFEVMLNDIMLTGYTFGIGVHKLMHSVLNELVLAQNCFVVSFCVTTLHGGVQ